MYTIITPSKRLVNCFVQQTVPGMLYSKKATLRRKRALANPGVGLQVSLFKDDTLEDLEDIENLETDFANLGMTHREHIAEVEAMKEREKYNIVKEKYFKQKLPNFLTWNDKEQIRLLHKADPEKWSVEKLSECFPALPDVIARIVKSGWTKNENKVVNHDESVQRNWEDFEKGKMKKLSPVLVEHLKKFSSRRRSLNVPTFLSSKKTVVNKNKTSGEFSMIISSYYDRLKPKNEADETINTGSTQNNREKESWNMYSKHVTLSELHHKIEQSASDGKDITQTDVFILQQVKQRPAEHSVVELKKEELTISNKYNSSEVTVASTNPRDYSFLNYPLKITIPKKAYKKGYTYKFNDCYYNDNGNFLYRVPGMEG